MRPRGGGQLLGVGALFVLAAACSGGSIDSEAASRGAGSGGDGGASGGSGGTVTLTGGSAGAFSTACPSCPGGTYGLVIHGDGDDLEMDLNAPDERDCPSAPLRGSTAGCSRSSIYLSACEEAQGGGACLELRGKTATYTQRDTGTVWTGDVTGLMRSTGPLPPGAESGTMTLELTSGSSSLTLTVDYAFCQDGAIVRVVC